VNASAPVLTSLAGRTRAPAGPPPADRAPVVRTTALLAVLALAGTVFAMMQALVIPALPRIQLSLGVNTAEAAWISTAYLLSACILTPVIGRLGEVAGKKRMMLASLATFAAGTLVCAVAGNLAELVAGRVIQGAAGGIYPLAFAIIRERLPRERVPGSIGLVSSLLGIGGGLGLVLPGPIMTGSPISGCSGCRSSSSPSPSGWPPATSRPTARSKPGRGSHGAPPY
jgi:MFS family permease